MKTILLLAGRSKRFWPLSEKSLFLICGKTLAEHQVETLKEGGCRDITLVVGAHNKKELRRIFPDLKSIEQKDLNLGMQGACLSALPKMKKGEPVLIVSGNDIIDPEAFPALLKAAERADGAILVRKVKKYFPGGYLKVKGRFIDSIVEKPGEGKEPSKLVNIVAHVHNDPTVLLAALRSVKNHWDDGYECALQTLFELKNYHAVLYEGFWQPVKYPWHCLPLLSHFLSSIQKVSIHRSVKVHPTAVIEGNVIIGEGSRIFPHATVLGPCVIGHDCIIGTNAMVRGSSIGDYCVIGYGTEVKSSILARAVWAHKTYLGDSVIGQNVTFGGGCITGNFRLDEGEIASASLATGLTKFGLIVGDYCRFGIQVGTNPGINVGPETFVVGGVFLEQDIPEKSFVDKKDGVTRVRANKTHTPSTDSRKHYKAVL